MQYKVNNMISAFCKTSVSLTAKFLIRKILYLLLKGFREMCLQKLQGIVQQVAIKVN